ncbi:SymE family type I addiction module toxin [Pseudomonas aeruginosa]
MGYQLYESRHSDWGTSRQTTANSYLRLSGDWLEAAGFEVGCKVSIQVTRRRLLSCTWLRIEAKRPSGRGYLFRGRWFRV